MLQRMAIRRSAFRVAFLGLALAASASSLAAAEPAEKIAAPQKKKVYIMTDLEGASGVFCFAQTRDEGPLNTKAKEYLMKDLDAVIRGLRAGGATEVVVYDGHGEALGTTIPEMMTSGATYITGLKRPYIGGLDESCVGVVQLGAHAMMGTKDGVLCHTQSSKSENRYWYNDVESGELAQVGLIAGRYGVPTILVTGDEATCREAKQFFGETCVTVAVKRGLGRETAELYAFPDTQKALYEGAKRAMAAAPHCKPYRIAMPIRAKVVRIQDLAKGTRATKEATLTDVMKVVSF